MNNWLTRTKKKSEVFVVGGSVDPRELEFRYPKRGDFFSNKGGEELGIQARLQSRIQDVPLPI